MELRYRCLRTSAGWVGFACSPRGLRRVWLGATRAAELRRTIAAECPGAVEDPKLMPELAAALAAYFAGRPVSFADVPVDWRGAPWFEVDVWRACREVPYGQTRTYRELAERVGRPGAARAVGQAMRRNPCPLVIPCHRIVRSDGRPGGYSAPGGEALKRRLLALESARVAMAT